MNSRTYIGGETRKIVEHHLGDLNREKYGRLFLRLVDVLIIIESFRYGKCDFVPIVEFFGSLGQ